MSDDFLIGQRVQVDTEITKSSTLRGRFGEISAVIVSGDNTEYAVKLDGEEHRPLSMFHSELKVACPAPRPM